MGKFVVAFTGAWENEIYMVIIEAQDWKEALLKHFKFNNLNENWDEFLKKYDNLEDAKEALFNSDILVNVIEIK